MIDAPERMQPLPDLEDWVCARCRNRIARGVLTVGSVLEIRCHQSIKLPNGKRETCGWVLRLAPSR